MVRFEHIVIISNIKSTLKMCQKIFRSLQQKIDKKKKKIENIN